MTTSDTNPVCCYAYEQIGERGTKAIARRRRVHGPGLVRLRLAASGAPGNVRRKRSVLFSIGMLPADGETSKGGRWNPETMAALGVTQQISGEDSCGRRADWQHGWYTHREDAGKQG